MIFLRVIFFILASVLEVQVHAGIVMLPREFDIAQEPTNCLVESSVCAVKTPKGRKYELTINQSKVMLGSNSIVVRLGIDSILLVQGEARIESHGRLKIETEFGQVESDDGVLWMVHETSRVLVRSLRGTQVLMRRGVGDDLPILEGFEIYISGVSDRGASAVTIPTVLNMRDHIKRAARLFSGTKREFRKDLQKLEVIVSNAAKESSRLHSQIVNRQLASVAEQQARAAENRRRYEAESRRLRQLFRERLNR